AAIAKRPAPNTPPITKCAVVAASLAKLARRNATRWREEHQPTPVPIGRTPLRLSCHGSAPIDLLGLCVGGAESRTAGFARSEDRSYSPIEASRNWGAADEPSALFLRPGRKSADRTQFVLRVDSIARHNLGPRVALGRSHTPDGSAVVGRFAPPMAWE